MKKTLLAMLFFSTSLCISESHAGVACEQWAICTIKDTPYLLEKKAYPGNKDGKKCNIDTQTRKKAEERCKNSKGKLSFASSKPEDEKLRLLSDYEADKLIADKAEADKKKADAEQKIIEQHKREELQRAMLRRGGDSTPQSSSPSAPTDSIKSSIPAPIKPLPTSKKMQDPKKREEPEVKKQEEPDPEKPTITNPLTEEEPKKNNIEEEEKNKKILKKEEEPKKQEEEEDPQKKEEEKNEIKKEIEEEVEQPEAKEEEKKEEDLEKSKAKDNLKGAKDEENPAQPITALSLLAESGENEDPPSNESDVATGAEQTEGAILQDSDADLENSTSGSEGNDAVVAGEE